MTKNSFFFTTRYYYIALVYGVLLTMGILFFKINIQTIILSLILIFYSYYSTFGRRIIISEDAIEYHLLFKKHYYNLEDISYARFTSVLYGHPMLFLYVKNKNRKLSGYINYSDKEYLKRFFETRKISNNL